MLAAQDWFGFVGNWIQSVFAWATYNRDGFTQNVALRQAQKYQQKNYHISWISVAREDLRNMMAISVTRQSNYVIVATLMLSVVASTLVSGNACLTTACPVFVWYAFYLSCSISCIFLGLSIVFGVRGQNSAFLNTMKLLTYQVRPENPTAYDHDYMTQAQWIEKAGLTQLFRVPGVNPQMGSDHFGTPASEAKPQYFGKHPSQDIEPLEHLDKANSDTWYLAKFSDFMRIWHPYDVHSKYAMGIGNICLGQGFTYLAVGTLMSVPSAAGELNEWVAVVAAVCSLYMLYAVSAPNFHIDQWFLRWMTFILLNIGPALGVLAAVTQNEFVEQILVPMAFLSHALFWFSSYCVVKQNLWQEIQTLDFADHGQGFWNRERRKNKKAGQTNGASGSGIRINWRNKSPERTVDPEAPDEFEIGVDLGEDLGMRSSHAPGTSSQKPQDQNPRNSLRRRARASTSADGSGAEWPTEEPEFAVKTSRTMTQARESLRHLLAGACLFWCGLFGWSVSRYWVSVADMTLHPAAGGSLAGSDPPLAVTWPGQLFRPLAVTCTGNRTFVADKFRVYEVFTNGAAAQRFACPGLSRQILDISVTCNSSTCWPIVLVASQGNEAVAGSIVDCGAGTMSPLLQDNVPAQAFTVLQGGGWAQNLTGQQILVAHGATVVIFGWSSENGWMPLWFPGTLAFLNQLAFGVPLPVGDGLAAVASFASQLVVFRSVTAGRPAIEARNVSQMKLVNRWVVPDSVSPIFSGCADSSTSVLVLTTARNVGDPRALVRLHTS